MRCGWALDHHIRDSIERELVRAAESGGLDSIWTMENHHLRDGVTTAAVALERTERIPVVMGTLSPFFRHPIEIGLTLANLERMYPGRTALNLGAGMQETLERIGVPIGRPLGQMREAVDVIRLFLTGERFEYHGERFQIEKHRLSGERLAMPPIYFSVMGPKLIALAGEVADGVNLPLASSPQYTAQSVKQFEAGSRTGDRDRSKQRICTEVLVQVGGDDGDDITGVRRLLGFHFSSTYFEKVVAPSGLPVDHAAIRDAYIKRDMARVDALITDEMVHTFTAVGSADAVIQRLKEYESAGTDMIVLYTAGPEETRVRTVTELAAALRRSNEAMASAGTPATVT